ncbi:hypothetical protein LCGC14_2803770 [marine sediment metagenome]|uniref:Uncharacterized protein n=1 Tax=marine sediment metagenome TaxID=412755 RepID=A0A0F9BDC0_9ZZZZ
MDAVAEDWEAIATAFPFLDLTCHLHDAEHCEDAKPIIEFRIVDGAVIVQDPTITLAPTVNDMIGNLLNLTNPARERGTSLEILKEKLETIYGEIPQYE